ncbi:MAG TPA: hypothetical protein DCQ98_00830 [Planctomycetaceae bacterium]|nr:hypothetical protein [Planctomycetaceae bacterium]HRF01125.1 hypothetical protein [Pirellulaceae bacterium]
MSFGRNSLAVSAILLSTFGIGCDGGADGGAKGNGADAAHAGESEGDAHPTAGPRGGELIELGAEDYHAELLHGGADGKITVHLLDSTGKQSVATEATELTINLKHDGSAEQFRLKAFPEPNDPVGKASRFVSDTAELAAEMEHEGAEIQLVVTIDGKPYRGVLDHHHDDGEHSGHSH